MSRICASLVSFVRCSCCAFFASSLPFFQALHLSVRGDFVLVGDVMSSATLLAFRPATNTLEEVARDFIPLWTTGVEFLSDDSKEMNCFFIFFLLLSLSCSCFHPATNTLEEVARACMPLLTTGVEFLSDDKMQTIFVSSHFLSCLFTLLAFFS